MLEGHRVRVHVEGSRPDIRVPFQEVHLSASPDGTANAPIRRYDTGGPLAERSAGLPDLRGGWIDEREDTELYEGRTARARDDGRAVDRGAPRYPAHPLEARRPRKAHPGRHRDSDALRPGGGHHARDRVRGDQGRHDALSRSARRLHLEGRSCRQTSTIPSPSPC